MISRLLISCVYIIIRAQIAGLGFLDKGVTKARLVCPMPPNAKIQNIKIWSEERFIDGKGTN